MQVRPIAPEPHNSLSAYRAGRPPDKFGGSPGSPKYVRSGLDSLLPEVRRNGIGRRSRRLGRTVHGAAPASQLLQPVVPVLRILLASNHSRRLAKGTVHEEASAAI